jgi:hypothetical protein
MSFTAGKLLRFLVALPPARDLLFSAKYLFVPARTVWHGLQSSRDERDQLGFSPVWQALEVPVMPGCSQLRTPQRMQ